MTGAERALELLDAAKKETDVEEARAAIAEAQVHATLALAAEQRTANAIAALKLSSADLEVKDPGTSKIEAGQERIRRRNALVEIVREGLGQA